MTKAPTILTGTHAGLRDDRTHIDLRDAPVPPKETPMTDEQFEQLKALLEPVSEMAKMMLAVRKAEQEEADAEKNTARTGKKDDNKGS